MRESVRRLQRVIALTVVSVGAGSLGVWIAPGGASAEIDAGRKLCFEVASGAPGDVAVVNLTPVEATGPGSGQLLSSDVVTPPIASNVNFTPGSFDPNVAMAPVGADGSVCFVNDTNANVDLVADHLATIAAAGFNRNPTANGAPLRVVDTRIGVGGTRLQPAQRLCFATSATPGDLAVVNLTPVNAAGPGNGVLTSSDAAVAPTASNVNFAPGTFDPNLGIAAVGSDRRLCFHNSNNAAVDLIADLLGTIKSSAVIPTASGAPTRLVDTRIDVGGGVIRNLERRCFPSGATPGTTAIVNLTPVNATAPGFGAMVPADQQFPASVSNVNFGIGTVDPNVAFTRVDATGRLCFTNSEHGSVDLVVDLLATIKADATVPTLPTRVAETRIERRDATSCTTATRCYAAGSNFYVSADGGATWKLSETAIPPFTAVGREGWSIRCVGDNACIATQTSFGGPVRSYASIDGGVRWRTPTSVRVVNALACPVANTCIAGGASGPNNDLLRAASVSSDAGRTWRAIPLPATPNSTIQSITCVTAARCLAVSIVSSANESIFVLTTTDGWQSVTVTEEPLTP